jgi:excisionase family DNA binding protein
MKTYRLESVARELDISQRSVLREVKDGVLLTIRVRGRVLVLEEDLQQYLAKKRQYAEQMRVEAH